MITPMLSLLPPTAGAAGAGSRPEAAGADAAQSGGEATSFLALLGGLVASAGDAGGAAAPAVPGGVPAAQSGGEATSFLALLGGLVASAGEAGGLGTPAVPGEIPAAQAGGPEGGEDSAPDAEPDAPADIGVPTPGLALLTLLAAVGLVPPPTQVGNGQDPGTVPGGEQSPDSASRATGAPAVDAGRARPLPAEIQGRLALGQAALAPTPPVGRLPVAAAPIAIAAGGVPIETEATPATSPQEAVVPAGERIAVTGVPTRLADAAPIPVEAAQVAEPLSTAAGASPFERMTAPEVSVSVRAEPTPDRDQSVEAPAAPGADRDRQAGVVPDSGLIDLQSSDGDVPAAAWTRASSAPSGEVVAAARAERETPAAAGPAVRAEVQVEPRMPIVPVDPVGRGSALAADAGRPAPVLPPPGDEAGPSAARLERDGGREPAVSDVESAGRRKVEGPAPALSGSEAGLRGPARLAEGEAPALRSLTPLAVERVVGAARMSVSQGGIEVRLRLHPESLGEVDVRIRWEGGVLSARLEAATPAAREALEAGVGGLRTALREQGIPVEQVQIGLRLGLGDRLPGQAGGGWAREAAESELRATPAEIVSSAPTPPTVPAPADGRLDIRI
jgi:hypothetical protein